MAEEKSLPVPPHEKVREALVRNREEAKILRRQLRVSEDHAIKAAELRKRYGTTAPGAPGGNGSD
jgi:hypothetical protein